jgi:hypothetical protein
MTGKGERLNLRVRMGISGRELEVTLWHDWVSPRSAREAIAREMGIEPIGMMLLVDDQLWADGSPAPPSLLDGAVLQVVRVAPTPDELRKTVVRRIENLSHNAPSYSHIFLHRFDRPHFEVFADLRPAFTVIGYMGMARILMLRTRARQYLELASGRPLTDADVWTEMVNDDDIWTQLTRVDRTHAREILWNLHTSGEIDLGELTARWQGDPP